MGVSPSMGLDACNPTQHPRRVCVICETTAPITHINIYYVDFFFLPLNTISYKFIQLNNVKHIKN